MQKSLKESSAGWAEKLRDVEKQWGVEKSGFIIHGTSSVDPITKQPLPKPVHFVVSPWSQGRFTDDTRKLYFLAKGSVDADKNETPYDSGVREADEETGINAHDILEGKVPGVTALHNLSTLCSRTIRGSGPNTWYSHVYDHEVAGIEHLTTLLKNPEAHEVPIVNEGVSLYSEMVAPESVPEQREVRLPDFDTMLGWLYDGKIPALEKPDGSKTDPVILDNAERFLRIEHAVMSSGIIERLNGSGTDDLQAQCVFSWRDAGDHEHKIKNSREFGFFRDLLGTLIKDKDMIISGQLRLDDRNWLNGQIDAVKDALLKAHILHGDCGVIKLDLRERPLKAYQEGADIIPVSEFITRVVNEAYRNKRYARNMINVHDAKHLKGGMVEAIETKQLGMMMQIAQPEDIEAADIPNEVKIAMRKIISAHLTRSDIDNGDLPEAVKREYLGYMFGPNKPASYVMPPPAR